MGGVGGGRERARERERERAHNYLLDHITPAIVMIIFLY